MRRLGATPGSEWGGEVIASYYAHPDGLPDAAATLAQLLALTTDEPGFRAIANRTAN